MGVTREKVARSRGMHGFVAERGWACNDEWL